VNSRLTSLRPLAEPVARRGLLGVLLMFFGLALMQVFGIPMFAALDEPRHIAYAIEVAEGKLPDVRDKVQLSKLHVRKIKGTRMMAAAAHPPLYYLLTGFPLKWASAGGDLTWGTWVSRCLTMLMGAIGLAYAYLAALLLVPGRRSLALGATALCAVMPAFDNVSALVHNDAFAFLSTSALVHAVLLALLQGPKTKTLISVGIWAAVAAAARFAALVAVAPALTAVGLLLLFGEQRPWSLRLRDALIFSVSVLALIAVTSGWFYLRSYRLYGDVTAGKALFEGLERPVRTPFLHNIVTPRLWHTLVTDLWGRLAGGVHLKGAVTLSGLVLLLGGWAAGLYRVARAARQHGQQLLRTRRTAAVVFIVVITACVVLPIFEFYSRGGNLTARYYFPVLWVPMLAAMSGYAAFDKPLPGVAALVFASLLGLWATDLYIGALAGAGRGNFAVAAAFERAGLPSPDLLGVLLLLFMATGMALLVSAWQELELEERRQP
jgi:hypothetical protein